ncbi:sigma-70 family RNA polymerase sigma factor [Photobacterium sp. SDRW27]|uniref:sigma-70 family RNA polymerase sigma factor n=1 Tax=Photobacterium obscurum TaxID=2829490 RepID=UPI0022448D7D|nr:sigma-70 family RNA polymerase sigma factor [Photobacterium obscurum]MCW8328471.1 sigma-70 family RNA polymerase sigma factor [Photobacterium obscurum]
MTMREHNARPCLMQAWEHHENQLAHWLRAQTHDEPLAQDLLHEVFIRAMHQDERFCNITNTKAWLFRVAGNLVIDQARKRTTLALPAMDDIEQKQLGDTTVDNLTNCLPRVLNELEPKDSDILKACDIHGMTQQQYANQHELSLPAVKSRLQRARTKLRQQLTSSCKVILDENQKVCCFTPRD